MSRIGKKPIEIPKGVTVEMEGLLIHIKGPRGQLSYQISPSISLEMMDSQLLVKRSSDSKTDRSLHGLTRALVQNMVTGVTDGFTKTLELSGVGYKALVQGNKLTFQVGYTHPVEYLLTEGITAVVEGNKIRISGANCERVGALAAKIRRIRKADPYKGKGVKYEGEVLRRKAGKALGKGVGK